MPEREPDWETVMETEADGDWCRVMETEADGDWCRVMETEADGDWCRAVSQHGTMVTAWIGGRMAFARAKPGRDFVCTQDAGHSGSHKACDGRGHVLASWPRKDPEQYWQRGDCAGHSHD